MEIYRFICDNFTPGDEIILLGFSRGAFTARSVADMVCKLGILNRAGLEKLPKIFHDYETWQDWKFESMYDEKIHLTAFTPESWMRLEKMHGNWNRGEADLHAKNAHEKVANDRKTLFQEMSKRTKGKKTNLRAMAEAYREKLREVPTLGPYTPPCLASI